MPKTHREEILNFVKRDKPEDLWLELSKIGDNESAMKNLIYYASRMYGNRNRMQDEMLSCEQEVGVTRVSEPHGLEVEAQLIEMNKLDPAKFDSRLLNSECDWSLLRNSDALIFNIDYPLGMAAYHVFSQVSTAGGRILGLYILGKAATLNARVGDVMIPNVVFDEHSQNSYLFRNCFTAQDVAPHLLYGTVFDNQKSVTVRGTILQNAQFMHVFYEEGYTDIEMEAGPYLSAIYEDVYPRRYPTDEIVNLFINTPYDIGIIHYASDTPISRRQMLLSKSLSYFGVDATYATSIAVLRRILQVEERRQRRLNKAIGSGVETADDCSGRIHQRTSKRPNPLPERLALAIAGIAYPEIEIERFLDQLDQLATYIGERLDDGDVAESRAQQFIQLFCEELGFQGNRQDYYHPDNSYLNRVLEARRGLADYALPDLCGSGAPRISGAPH